MKEIFHWLSLLFSYRPTHTFIILICGRDALLRTKPLIIAARIVRMRIDGSTDDAVVGLPGNVITSSSF
jgi:hypothetical protein